MVKENRPKSTHLSFPPLNQPDSPWLHHAQSISSLASALGANRSPSTHLSSFSSNYVNDL